MTAIIVQSFIAAPPGEVWAALFRRADILFDALPPQAWPSDREEQAPLFVACDWSWSPAPTSVRLLLHEMGGGTKVDVRHDGWGEAGEWEASLQGHFAGWLQGLAALGLALETEIDARVAAPELRGRTRYFISGEIPAPAAPVFRSLTDADVLERWSEGLFATAIRPQELDDRFARWAFADGREVTAILRPTPRGTHVALAEYGGSTAASERWPAMFERLTEFLV